MTERAKRRIKEPKKFDPNDNGDGVRTGRPSRSKKQVFRLLKRRDITTDLLGETVHIVWPDNGAWYTAVIKQLKVRQLRAEVEYTRTGEVEQVDLAELVKDGQLAVVEDRPPGHEYSKDEIPVEGALRDVNLPDNDSEGGEADGEDAGGDASAMAPDDEEEPEPEQADTSDTDASEMDLEESVAKRRGKRQRGHPEAIARLSKRAKPAALVEPEPEPEKQKEDEDEEYAAAEQRSQQFLASVIGQKQVGPRPTSNFYGESKPTVKRPPPAPVTQTKSFKPQVAADERIRNKVREQLTDALAKAASELAAEDGGTEAEQPSPAEVSSAVESAMYRLYGSVGPQYKSKARALLFNLRDTNNPQLRGRVLTGDIKPDALVQMTSEELASKELSEWRSRRAEEALKASVLDEEAAAQFSTAAALAQQQKQKQGAYSRATTPATEPLKIPGDDSERPSSPEAAVTEADRPAGDTASPAKAEDGPASPTNIGGIAGGLRADSTDLGGAKPAAATLHVPTDWASIKAQADATTPAKKGALPKFEDFDSFKVRHVSDDTDGDMAWQPDSPSGEGQVEGVKASIRRSSIDSPALPDEEILGDQVWEGPVRGLDAVGTFGAAAYSIHGNADWGELLHNPEMLVKGLVRLEKLAPFFEELRTASRHRTMSLALLRSPPGASPSASDLIAKAAAEFSKRRRAGVAEPVPGLEAYFLPSGGLADQLLRAARKDTPTAPVPRSMGDHEMLLAVVHAKGWTLPAPLNALEEAPRLAASMAQARVSPAQHQVPAAAASASAAVEVPPPPSLPLASQLSQQPQPSSALGMAVPAAELRSPSASAADPRQPLLDPRRAAAPNDPRSATAQNDPRRALADPRRAATTESRSPPPGSADAALPQVSGAVVTSLADILRTVQQAGVAPAPLQQGNDPRLAGTSSQQTGQQPSAEVATTSSDAAGALAASQPAAGGATASSGVDAAVPVALPPGLDLSSISALAAALGVGGSSSSGPPQQQPQLPLSQQTHQQDSAQPGSEAVRDPRRDPRSAVVSPPPPPMGQQSFQPPILHHRPQHDEPSSGPSSGQPTASHVAMFRVAPNAGLPPTGPPQPLGPPGSRPHHRGSAPLPAPITLAPPGASAQQLPGPPPPLSHLPLGQHPLPLGGHRPPPPPPGGPQRGAPPRQQSGRFSGGRGTHERRSWSQR